MKKTLLLLVISLAATSCVRTVHKRYDPITGRQVQKTVLAGNYGITPKSTRRGNLGNGGKGGLLGAVLPGFNYEDGIEREFYEPKQKTRIHIGADGSLTIEGPVDHSTGQDIQSHGINRAIRNIATLIGWNKALDTVKDIRFQSEKTKRGASSASSGSNGGSNASNGGGGGGGGGSHARGNNGVRDHGRGEGRGGRGRGVGNRRH